MLPQVEFVYNATRALGIVHAPFEDNFGFSQEEPPNFLFNMRPSIPVSQNARERLNLLHEMCAVVHTVLLLHKDKMQARSKPSTALHFARECKVTFVTKNLFLCGQLNRKLRDRQLGPFSVEEVIGKHICELRPPATAPFHPVLHVNNLKPCFTTLL
jgi:hypothetical protein